MRRLAPATSGPSYFLRSESILEKRFCEKASNVMEIRMVKTIRHDFIFVTELVGTKDFRSGKYTEVKTEIPIAFLRSAPCNSLPKVIYF